MHVRGLPSIIKLNLIVVLVAVAVGLESITECAGHNLAQYMVVGGWLGNRNRFEFRAVGSVANCASSLIVLNTAIAEVLEDFKARVDALVAKGEDQTSAIIDIVCEDIKTCKPIRFDGNGYSGEWKERLRSVAWIARHPAQVYSPQRKRLSER